MKRNSFHSLALALAAAPLLALGAAASAGAGTASPIRETAGELSFGAAAFDSQAREAPARRAAKDRGADEDAVSPFADIAGFLGAFGIGFEAHHGFDGADMARLGLGYGAGRVGPHGAALLFAGGKARRRARTFDARFSFRGASTRVESYLTAHVGGGDGMPDAPYALAFTPARTSGVPVRILRAGVLMRRAGGPIFRLGYVYGASAAPDTILSMSGQQTHADSAAQAVAEPEFTLRTKLSTHSIAFGLDYVF